MDGTHLAALRAHAVPDFPILSDHDIAISLRETLDRRPIDESVWVFGYGSLIWNPAIDFIEKRRVLLNGWHRRFCLSSTGRGTPEKPGAMLALAKDGHCEGVAFRLEETKVNDELLMLWHREMLNGSCQAQWLTAQSMGNEIPVLTFVVNPNHPRFIGDFSETEIAKRIAFAHGPSGTNLEYLYKTIEAISALGINDSGIERIRLEVEAVLNAALNDG